MAAQGQVAVANASATAIFTASAGPVTIVVRNDDATNNIFIGGSTVTATGGTTGFKLAPGAASPPIPLRRGDTLYGRANAGTPNAQYVVTGPGA